MCFQTAVLIAGTHECHVLLHEEEGGGWGGVVGAVSCCCVINFRNGLNF